MQVDQDRTSGGASKAFGHADDDLLMQAEHEAEVIAESCQERQLVRSRIAEDRRHSMGAEDIQTGLQDSLASRSH